ncbi:MAG TPA: two-component regulator propeller domain-containing protein, partial [Fibrobacteria bacterium]|nr:two-component regulator propeller domain-containing protein [Fibrobacteria bacterium]
MSSSSRYPASGLPRRVLALSLLTALLLPEVARAQGSAAVITLVMPVGARQLGMGEAAVALADDVFGTFWNPAGIAFGPVSNEWELVLPTVYRKNGVDLTREFTALAAKPRSGLLLKSIVWAGAKDGLLLYNGKQWREYHEVVLEQGDKVDKLVRRYAGTGDNIDSLIARVKAYNKVSTPEEEAELISLKLPYNLLFPGQAVTALALDNSDRLWVGTPTGLFRFDGSGWKSFDKEPGFTYLAPDTAAGAATADPAPGSASAALALPDTNTAMLAALKARDTAKTAADTAKADSLKAKADSLRTAAKALLDSAAQAAQASDSAAKSAMSAAVASGQGAFRTLGITALAVKGSSIWIGTDDGLYEYRKNTVLRRGQTLLPSQYVSAITTNESL